MKLLALSICVGLVSFNIGAKLPSNFIKCDIKQPNFQQCLTKAVENALKQMNRSFRKAGLLNIEPLEIPAMTVGAGSQLVYTQQDYKHLKLSGFNETTCTKVEFDTDTKILKLDCIIPRFRMEFDYEIHGQVLTISIYGKGAGWVIFQDNHVQLTYKLGEYEKKGKKYYNVVNQQLKMQPKGVDFDLTNLFDGDEEAAERVKKIFKDNSHELYNDVKPGYEEAFGLVFASVFDRILTKIPVAYLFGEK